MSLEPTRASRVLNHSRTWAIIWPFLAIVVILVMMAYFCMNTLAAMRAAVTGESAWSKAQKEAVYDLVHYAQSREERDYQRFLRAVEVIHWDQRIREEMDKPVPDRALVRHGMMLGHIPVDDIDTTYHFYRRFRDFAFLKRVVALWKGGDAGISSLIVAGERLHAQITAEANGAPPQPLDLESVYAIDAAVTPLATRFSETLGEVARELEMLLIVGMLAIAATLVPIGVLLAQRMVRKGQAFERALSVSEERFELAVSGSNDGVWDWDVSTGALYLSPRFKELLGFRDQALVASVGRLLERLHAEDRRHARRRLWLQGRRAGVIDFEARLRMASEDYRWFRIRGQAIRDARGRPLRMVGSMSDTTAYRQAADALIAEKERLRVTLEAIGDAVVTTDTEGRVQYLNPAAELLTGWDEEQARDRRLGDICRVIDEQTREPLLGTVKQALNDERLSTLGRITLLVQRSGHEVAVSTITAPIRDEQRQVRGMVVALRDVSQERRHAADLLFQASHDALTGLINRREFDNRLARALETARNEHRAHAVLYLDLDQFKVVNDTCGHAAGDELIRQISVLLLQRLRVSDTLARLGGDEFGVLLENCGPDDALRIADGLRETMVSFRFAWQGQPFSLGVSIGLVNVLDTAMTPTSVLSTADATCYLAKEKGRNRVQVYRPDDRELLSRRGEMEWVSRIRDALEQNRLQLYAQAIAPLQGPAPPGLHIEVLLRMIDPNGPVVPPMAFIPAAERFGIMSEIDRWVIEETFATFAARMQKEGPDVIALCAINISGVSLGEERFLSFVLDQFVRYDVPFDRICFEVTETAAIANLSAANLFISRLQALGCLFALDDFGSGMSSFAYLKQLPVEYLKIDGAFVKDMLDDAMDRSMVEAINHIGHVMGKKTIAEFAENAAIIRELQRLGVDYAQGYGVGEPVPFSELRWKGRQDAPSTPLALG